MKQKSDERPRRLVGVSLKMYFSISKTHDYTTEVAKLGPLASSLNVDLFVIPDFVSLLPSKNVLEGSGVVIGAQDTFWEDIGAFTGEVSPAVLREAGCRFVETGHAERRRFFGETNEQVAKKARAITRNHMVPLVCIGEKKEAEGLDEGVRLAIEECCPQVESVLAAIPDDAELALAYEPVWAIGQSQPAAAQHVVAVCQGIRKITAGRKGLTRILYGGSAGPGLFTSLKNGVDGLFLGRFAHDIASFKSVIQEVADVS